MTMKTDEQWGLRALPAPEERSVPEEYMTMAYGALRAKARENDAWAQVALGTRRASTAPAARRTWAAPRTGGASPPIRGNALAAKQPRHHVCLRHRRAEGRESSLRVDEARRRGRPPGRAVQPGDSVPARHRHGAGPGAGRHLDRARRQAGPPAGAAGTGARVYERGLGPIVADRKRYWRWLLLALHQAYLPAQMKLGRDYRTGANMDRADVRQGFTWTMIAAAGGEPNAMADLAVCYAEGLGCEKSDPLAVAWMARRRARRPPGGDPADPPHGHGGRRQAGRRGRERRHRPRPQAAGDVMASKLTPELKRDFDRLAPQARSVRDLARTLGVVDSSLYYWARRGYLSLAGVRGYGTGSRKPYTPEMEDRGRGRPAGRQVYRRPGARRGRDGLDTAAVGEARADRPGADPAAAPAEGPRCTCGGPEAEAAPGLPLRRNVDARLSNVPR